MKLKPLHKTKAFEFYTAEVGKSLEMPYFEDGVSAGFPSTATDYLDAKLDLNDLLIQNPFAIIFHPLQNIL